MSEEPDLADLFLSFRRSLRWMVATWLVMSLVLSAAVELDEGTDIGFGTTMLACVFLFIALAPLQWCAHGYRGPAGVGFSFLALATLWGLVAGAFLIGVVGLPD